MKKEKNHNYFRILVYTLCILIQSEIAFSQKNETEDADVQQNQNLEILSEQLEVEDADYTNLVETYAYYAKHPINLNTTSREDLAELQILNEIQIGNLLSHIEKNGRLFTIYELQGIEGFDLLTIKKILPYVRVSDEFTSSHFTIKEVLTKGKHDIISRYQRILEKQAGFENVSDSIRKAKPNSFYVGSPERIFTRYRFTYGNNVSIGFIGEKDAGESFKRIDSLNKKAGFDFYTAHLFLRNIKFVKALAIGDYQASFGQGLVLWKGFAFGKSSIIANVKRNAQGLRAYNSVDENRFMRGAASTLKFGKIETSVFFSRKAIDANPSKDTLIEGALDVEEISSLIATGQHTTPNEIKNKDIITENIFGANINYRGKRASLGTTYQEFRLSADLVKNPQPYNQFDFSGKINRNMGLDFSYVFRNFNFFGEAAMSQNGGKAIILGNIMALDPRANFTVLFRNFSKDYQNLQANAVSENTLPQNEQGLYFGFESKLSSSINFSAYYDQFKFPWMKFQVSGPSIGHDIFTQLNWTPNKKTDMYFRYRKRTKQINGNSEDLFDNLLNVSQENFRYNVSFQVIPYLKLRSRVEYVIYKRQDRAPENGLVIFQDISYKKIGSPLELSFRYALFETDSYFSRVYAYENDVLYSFSIPALYDKGSRVYLMANYSVNRNIELWIRIAQTFYTNKNIQNEGSITEINAPSKTELKLQVRFKF